MKLDNTTYEMEYLRYTWNTTEARRHQMEQLTGQSWTFLLYFFPILAFNSDSKFVQHFSELPWYI